MKALAGAEEANSEPGRSGCRPPVVIGCRGERMQVGSPLFQAGEGSREERQGVRINRFGPKSVIDKADR